MTGRVLIVDDEPAFANYVRQVALGLGADVEVVLNSNAFATAYTRFKPTLIVMDLVMPEMDGIELLQWLKNVNCATPIILVSGYNPDYARMAEMIGSRGTHMTISRLVKPIPVEALEAALRNGLERETAPAAVFAR